MLQHKENSYNMYSFFKIHLISPTHLIKLFQSFWHSRLELFVSIPQFPWQFHLPDMNCADQYFNIKRYRKWSPFWPLYPDHVYSFAGRPLSMFLYVVAIKLITYFDDNDNGFCELCWWHKYFLRWHQLLCQTQAHSDTIWKDFQL